ncbi:MAG: winged helix-turn-helix transcriptional regulator [Curvibacter sp.]|nr:winged helix-turn-helix transcriptional regulator [Curvibacter sp.]
MDAKPLSTDVVSRPQGCSNFKLRALMRRVAQHFDAEMARCGLKTTQYSLLTCVDRLGPIQPSVLASTMHLEPSTLTRNLRPLIDQGWVQLQAGQDARSRLVLLTDAGRDKRRDAQRHWRQAQNRLNALLGEASVAALHVLLDDCLERLGPADPPT